MVELEQAADGAAIQQGYPERHRHLQHLPRRRPTRFARTGDSGLMTRHD
jgi:hypothetical protein